MCTRDMSANHSFCGKSSKFTITLVIRAQLKP